MTVKKIVLVTVLGIIVPVSLVFAQNITVSQDVTISLTGIGRYLQLLSTSSALNQFTINDAGTTLTVVLVAGSGSVTIASTEGLDMGGSNNDANIALSQCNSSGSKLIITADSATTKTVVITPNNTICSSSSAVSASGGPGGDTSSSQQAGVSTSSQTPDAGDTEVQFVDIGKLKDNVQQAILQLATLMIEKDTFEMPKNKKFQPNASARGEFILRTALAVSGIGCGESGNGYPGASQCKKQAVSKKLVTDKFKLNAKMSRAQYYDVLLKAMGVKLVSASTKDLKAVCKDTKKMTKKMAQVFMTARDAGIASVYKGKKCGLESAFPRWQAAQFAARSLNIK